MTDPFTRIWLEELQSSHPLGADETQLFSWYLRETDGVISRMELEEGEYLQQQVTSGDPEPNDSGLIAVAYYSRRMRYSHVIYLASMLETVMKRECRRLLVALGEHNVPFVPSELKGDPWTTKRKALERYGRFEIPPALWDPINELLEVRDALVHDNGTTDAMHPNRERALANIAGITVSSSEIEVNRDFIQRAFLSVQALGAFLNERVGQVIERRIRPQMLD